jgi:hypothetical protein
MRNVVNGVSKLRSLEVDEVHEETKQRRDEVHEVSENSYYANFNCRFGKGIPMLEKRSSHRHRNF